MRHHGPVQRQAQLQYQQQQHGEAHARVGHAYRFLSMLSVLKHEAKGPDTLAVNPVSENRI